MKVGASQKKLTDLHVSESYWVGSKSGSGTDVDDIHSARSVNAETPRNAKKRLNAREGACVLRLEVNGA